MLCVRLQFAANSSFHCIKLFPVIKVLAAITALISNAGSAVAGVNFVKDKTRGVKNDSKVTVPAKGLMRSSVL